LESVDGLVIEILGRDDLLDDLSDESVFDEFVGDILRMLGGDDDGVDTDRGHVTSVTEILDGDLGLAIWAEPVVVSVVSELGDLLDELGGQDVGQRHVLLGLVGGISEHVSLITSSDLLDGLSDVDSGGDLRGLLLDGDEDVASLVVETLGGVIETDSLDGVTDDLLVVDDGLGSDPTQNHNHTSLGASLTSDLGFGILGEASIKDSIRDLIAELIWMSLRNGLGSEVDSLRHDGVKERRGVTTGPSGEKW